jgi:HNH endonuclease
MSRLPAALRRAVQERARGLCEYCQSSIEITGQEFTVDHIVPRSLGGDDDVSNLCFCCFGCNTHKQAATQGRDPRTRQVAPLFNPRLDRWNDHFRWSPTWTRIIGRTAVGRATVEVLHLNRLVLVRARIVWAQNDLHPPELPQ